jgi:hypothetical protein
MTPLQHILNRYRVDGILDLVEDKWDDNKTVNCNHLAMATRFNCLYDEQQNPHPDNRPARSFRHSPESGAA